MQVNIFLVIILFITALIISNAQKSLEYLDKFDTKQYTREEWPLKYYLASNKLLSESNDKIYYSITIEQYISNQFFHDILEYSSPYCELLNFYEISNVKYSQQKYVFKCKEDKII
jgi:hypothetical protein